MIFRLAATYILSLACLAGGAALGQSAEDSSAKSPSFSRPVEKNALDLFAWSDTCNVYVVRDGEAGLQDGPTRDRFWFRRVGHEF